METGKEASINSTSESGEEKRGVKKYSKRGEEKGKGEERRRKGKERVPLMEGGFKGTSMLYDSGMSMSGRWNLIVPFKLVIM